MDGRTILYRGILKSCNYHCSYCPFSRHPVSERELAKDREQWFSFIRFVERHVAGWGIRALMVVPYGEALIHPWYWQGLAQLSALPQIRAVGAQTNLSFPLRLFTDCFAGVGGQKEKLRLWATFHPEMTEVSVFAERCRELHDQGVQICAGAVGVPQNLPVLESLRRALPEEIYLWINKMDGLKRPYTDQERAAFTALDPYFIRELLPVPADTDRCRERLFAEGDGRLHTCNISPPLGLRWAEKNPDLPAAGFPAPVCRRKICSCYLAYGGRNDPVSRMLFGPYPLFRIPRRPRAVFLDIAGILLPNGECMEEFSVVLPLLAQEGTVLFLTARLSYREAMERCQSIRHLFRGGIFAGGAYLVLQSEGECGEGREQFFDLDEFWNSAEPFLQKMARCYAFRILCYKHKGRCYKITLLRPRHRPWEEAEAHRLYESLPGKHSVRAIRQGSCLQFVDRRADQAGGVRLLCRWMGISHTEVFLDSAAGEEETDKRKGVKE